MFVSGRIGGITPADMAALADTAHDALTNHTRTLGNNGIREAVFVVEDVKDEATGHGTANGYVARASVQIFNRDGSTAR